jgi:hypothetical protein
LIFDRIYWNLWVVIEFCRCILAELAFLGGRRLEGELLGQLYVCTWKQGSGLSKLAPTVSLSYGISNLQNYRLHVELIVSKCQRCNVYVDHLDTNTSDPKIRMNGNFRDRLDDFQFVIPRNSSAWSLLHLYLLTETTSDRSDVLQTLLIMRFTVKAITNDRRDGRYAAFLLVGIQDLQPRVTASSPWKYGNASMGAACIIAELLGSPSNFRRRKVHHSHLGLRPRYPKYLGLSRFSLRSRLSQRAE